MNLISLFQNAVKELFYFYDKHKTGFVQIETLYNTTLPKCHSKYRGMLLFEFAKHSKASIVELGSWGGAASVALAEGSFAGNLFFVFSIDSHRAFKTKQGYVFNDTTEILRINMLRSKASALIRPIFKMSNEVLANWKKPIGLLFVDIAYTDHRAAARKWKKFVIDRGFVICLTPLNEPDLKLIHQYDGFYCYEKVERQYVR